MNLPLSFENRMKDMLKEDYASFRESYNEDKKTGLRVNELKITTEKLTSAAPFEMKKVPWCETGFTIEERNDKPGRHSLHDAGAYYLQEPSAMAVADAVVIKKGMKVLDLCAAPGGKSTQIASFLRGEGLLVSNEINPTRAKILSQNIERMGVKNCVVLNETPDRIADVFEEYFDVVFVDAPCSGEGMFRKDETAVKEWSPENVSMCAKRQKEILAEAVKTVKPGGILCYSTCTFAPDEDEDNAAWLIEEYPFFSIVKAGNAEFFDCGHPEWITGDFSESTKEAVRDSSRLWPHKIEGEGHFICVFKKADEDGFYDSKPDKKKNANKSLKGITQKFIDDNLVDFEIKTEDIIQVDDQMFLKPDALDVSLSKLHVVRLGLNIGTVKKDRMEPSHSLAMALSKEKVKRSVELDEEETILFRHGEELKKDVENGWVLVMTNGVSLGWGKAAGGTIKNHYPKGLRIKY